MTGKIDKFFGINDIEKRQSYLDILRVIAVFLVIFTHTGDYGSKLYMYNDYPLFKELIYISADVIRCINIPVFWMISGTLLLRRNTSYREILFKRVPQYIVILIVFSAFYYFVFWKKAWNGLGSFVSIVWSGSSIGLLWFVYAYIGFLLALPILQKCAGAMKDTDFKYLIVLGIVLKAIFPYLSAITGMSEGAIDCMLVADTIFYPLVGYYLGNRFDEVKMSNKYWCLATLVTFASLCLTTIFVYWDKMKNGDYSEQYLFTNSVFLSVFTFALIKRLFCSLKVVWVRKILQILGEATFGTYLISMYVQNNLYGIYNRAFDLTKLPLLSGYIYVVGCYIACLIIIILLRLIPLVRKFI